MRQYPASSPDDRAPEPPSLPSVNPYSSHMQIRNQLIDSLLNTPHDQQEHDASASSSPSTSTPNMERLSLNASPLPTRVSLLQQASYDPPYWLDNAAFQHGQSTSWSLPWPAVVPWFELHPAVRVAAKADPFIAAFVEYHDDKYKHERERLSLLSHASDHYKTSKLDDSSSSSSSQPGSSANQPPIRRAVPWSQRLVDKGDPRGPLPYGCVWADAHLIESRQ